MDSRTAALGILALAVFAGAAFAAGGFGFFGMPGLGMINAGGRAFGGHMNNTNLSGGYGRGMGWNANGTNMTGGFGRGMGMRANGTGIDGGWNGRMGNGTNKAGPRNGGMGMPGYCGAAMNGFLNATNISADYQQFKAAVESGDYAAAQSLHSQYGFGGGLFGLLNDTTFAKYSQIAKLSDELRAALGLNANAPMGQGARVFAAGMRTGFARGSRVRAAAENSSNVQ